MAEPNPQAPQTPSPEPEAPLQDNFSSIIDETQAVFTGHPAEETTLGEGEEAADTPPESTADTATEAGATPPETTPPETPAQTLKYKSQEEAEAAAAEAQRSMQQKAEEAAYYRRRLEEQERDQQAARETADTPPAQDQPPRVERPEPLDVEAHIENAYLRASQIDPDAEGSLEQQRQILAKAYAEVDAYRDRLDQWREQQYNDRIQRLETAQAEQARMAQEQTQLSERDRITNKLHDMAREAGLDIQEPAEGQLPSQHYLDLHYLVDKNLYPENVTEDEAIRAVIDTVKKARGITGQPPAPTPSSNGLNGNGATPPSTAALPPQPMERAGVGRPIQTQEAEKPLSLNDAINSTLTPRRT